MKKDEEIKIRQATMADMESLCKVRNNEKLFRDYLEECDGERAYFLVGEIEEKIVGFGLVYLDITKRGKKKSHLPKLSDLYVAQEYRKKGVGKALVEARELLAKQYGYLEIYVSIDPFESIEMINLAKKLDYQAIQAQPYQVTATYYDKEGQPYEHKYFRLDFRKTLK